MANRRKDTMDIRDLLLELRVTSSDRAVSRNVGMHRDTVKRYRAWAQEQGLLAGPLPPLEDLQALVERTLVTPPPPQNVSSVEAYRDLVARLRADGAEIAAIWGKLQSEGYAGSYSAVRRFVRTIDPCTPNVTVRVEVQPGEEIQVDFGYAGRMVDPATGELRRAWAFVMTLSWSRHQYVEFVFDQTVATWLLLQRHGLEFFGGVPARVVIDNLKTAITRACFDDPEVQYAYRECAEHYGFRIGPCRPRTPEHKGKVEQGGVHYVKRNFVAVHKNMVITQANEEVRRWCLEIAGQRIHGTTKQRPLVRFAETEQACLQPLPEAPYDLAVWKVAKLHRDCYIVFEGSYYSAPYRLVGQQLRVRGGSREVRLYTLDHHLVATHPRAERPGERQTCFDHLPPHKVPGLTRTRESVQEEARHIGPATGEVVQRLLDDPVLDRLHTAGRLLRLSTEVGTARLEAACLRALCFDDPTYKTIKGILHSGLDRAAPATLDIAPAAQTFVRSAAELVGDLAGGATWS